MGHVVPLGVLKHQREVGVYVLHALVLAVLHLVPGGQEGALMFGKGGDRDMSCTIHVVVQI